MAIDIIEVKRSLNKLKDWGLLGSWELSATSGTSTHDAVFFFDIIERGEDVLGEVTAELSKFDNVSFRFNPDQSISRMQYRLTFSKEEKELNESRYIR